MQRIQSAISWTILASEVSHVFCCVIPSIVSVLSLLAGLGFMSFMPSWLGAYHDMIHAYELPVIGFSALVLLSGWVLHGISLRLDCRSTGCGHEPCKPKKFKASKILIVASLLFAMNVIVYFTLHYQA